MIRFNCDYLEGAHPRIMEAMIRTNLEQNPGYGEDPHCENARAMIRKLCGNEEVGVHFLVGGTQANLTVLCAMLRPWQGVLSCDTGHINVHETGAIEATGHKVLARPGVNGKLTAEEIATACREHFNDATHEHQVMPGAVYLSQSTEIGTFYTAKELREIRAVCDEYGLFLYVDGARLGYAMAAEGCDTDLPLLTELCDAFYIGGTKQGALFGEAVVIPNRSVHEHFRYLIKQKGGMLAKGRLLGIQFEELFRDDLYLELSRYAVRQALRIRDAAVACGIRLTARSETNQQFFLFPNVMLRELEKEFVFSPMGLPGETETEARICTSWATKEEDVDHLIARIRELA